MRDTIDAALFRLARLRRASKLWVKYDDEWNPHAAGHPAAVRASVRLQSRAFDEIDGFMAAFARVSFLLHPVSKSAFAKLRATDLRSTLGLPAGSVLNDTSARDSWVHHDERIDFATENGIGRNGQRFTSAASVTAAMKRGTLRIVEMDSLTVHYRDRAGNFMKVSLPVIGTALEELAQQVKAKFSI